MAYLMKIVFMFLPVLLYTNGKWCVCWGGGGPMYDPCTLHNVGWGRLVERQTIIEEIVFHINTNTYCHFCLMVQASVILSRNQI